MLTGVSDARTQAQPVDSLGHLMALVASAIRQRPHAAGEGIAFELPQPAPAALDADLCFAFPELPDLGLRVRFEGSKAVLEPGRGEPEETVHGSVEDFLDFFENRRSSQALFLERDWRMGDGGGTGPRDVDEIHGYVRALEELLPAPYEATEETRDRARANARRLGASVDLAHRSDVPPSAFASEFVAAGRPVVLRGAVGGIDWWSFDRLHEVLGDDHTHFSRYPNCSYSVGRCIDAITAGHRDAFKAALPVTRALRERYSLDGYLSAEGGFPPASVFVKAQALLIAPADEAMPASYRATSWHRDWADNLLAELIGTKMVRLVSPASDERFGLSSTPACHYNVAVDHSPLDPKDEQALDGLTVLEARLTPGDLLFIPCGWLHTVENVTASAAVNCWRVSPPERLGVRG